MTYGNALFTLVQSQLNFDATCCSIEKLELLSTDATSHSLTSVDGSLLMCDDFICFSIKGNPEFNAKFVKIIESHPCLYDNTKRWVFEMRHN
jgi:hypothetical protein